MVKPKRGRKMEREKQIEEIAKVIQNTHLPINQGNVTVGETQLSNRDTYRLAEALYNAGYRKERQGEWISVEDRLPQEDTRVLVAIEVGISYTNVDTDRVLDGRWVRWGTGVKYWHPLPTLPKMKGAEQ